MPGTLVDDLVEAGLVTEAQVRAVAVDQTPSSTVRVLERLVAAGLDERTLGGFFVSKGYGPMLQSADLARVDPDLRRRLSAADAHELCAMPLRPSSAGAVVAMADPTDQRAIAKLSMVFGGRILPIVAKLSDLVAAIARAYPTTERPTSAGDPGARSRSRQPSSVVPLVREKKGDTDRTLDDMVAPVPRFASTPSPEWDRAWSRSTTERDVSMTPLSTRIPRPVASDPPSASFAPSEPASDPNLDLADLRRADSRDAAVEAACRACLTIARGVAFLALRKGVFRGWDGAGENVTSASIRSLWVPASNPSILNEVLHSGTAFRGPYGETAADHLFRAAFGNRGREVVAAPVLIGSRMVGVLCANDPVAETPRFERVAEALGHAFERLIVSNKTHAS